MDQLNHAIPADPRSARAAAQAAGKTHHPIKSMLAWMIGSSLRLKLPITLAEWQHFAKPAALGEVAGIRSVGDGTGRFRARRPGC
jgi:hypothetical protein